MTAERQLKKQDEDFERLRKEHHDEFVRRCMMWDLKIRRQTDETKKAEVERMAEEYMDNWVPLKRVGHQVQRVRTEIRGDLDDSPLANKTSDTQDNYSFGALDQQNEQTYCI